MGAERNAQPLDSAQELELLRLEYSRLTAEMRMFAEQYSSKFNIFAVLVVSTFTFALVNPQYAMIYPIIPLFIFLIAGFTIAQAYVIACLAIRLRQIGRRVADMNKGVPILTWDHIIGPKLFLPGWIRIRRISDKNAHFQSPNPILVAVILSIVAVCPLIIYCVVKSWSVLPAPWNLLYSVFIGGLLFFLLVQSMCFFRLGAIAEDLDFYGDGGLPANRDALPTPTSGHG